MARKSICDGTGDEIPDDAPVTGRYGRQYSDSARVIAAQYLTDLDALHTECAADFQTKMDRLRRQYKRQLRKLPDEP